MKKYFVIAVSLVAVIGMITAVFATIRSGDSSMPILFHKRDLPDEGLRIITPVDASFDATALKYFKRREPETLKPFSVFIQNSNNKTLVAYVLTWKFTKQEGQITSKTVGYSEPGVLMGDPVYEGPHIKHTVPIKPNGVRCFTWDSQILEDDSGLAESTIPPGQSAVQQMLFGELRKATDVTVTLDGAIFDDGTFVGSNQVFFQQLQAVVNAKVDLLEEIAEASRRGKVGEAFRSIKAKSEEPDVPVSENFSVDNDYRFYRKMFAAEISLMLNEHGEEKVGQHLLKRYKQSHRVKKKQ